MAWLEHRVPPPVVMLIVAALMGAGSWLAPAASIEWSLRLGVAVLLAASGLLIAGAGVRTFGRAETTINPVRIEEASSLVTGGIFGYTRNPMYLGMVLVLLGWAACLGSPWLLLGPVLFVLFIERFQIRPEEAVLQSKFGEPYADYQKRVRRWI